MFTEVKLYHYIYQEKAKNIYFTFKPFFLLLKLHIKNKIDNLTVLRFIINFKKLKNVLVQQFFISFSSLYSGIYKYTHENTV